LSEGLELKSANRELPAAVDLPSVSNLKIAAVIPARLASTRMSRKVLREIAGRPMVEWVWRAAAQSGLMDPVLVATDSEEVAAVCRARGIPVEMTSPECLSGSDRVREVARRVDADIYVNIQGDEPMLTPEFFPPLLALFDRPEVQVATLAVRCPPHEIANPNAVKVVTAIDGRALYFSRATIPFDREGSVFAGDGSLGRHVAEEREPSRCDQQGAATSSKLPKDTLFPRPPYRKHLGIYAYRKAALERFAGLPPGSLERVERLEQLRLLENGIDLYVAPAPFDTIGVDTEEDFARAEAALRERAAYQT
jgi:3-deoxy-manno-octulosonate cytidylyltransferase (CMP-KDO synthetase)